MPVFDRLRHRRDDRHVFLYAFDSLQLDSLDLRREPIEDRKAELTKLLRRAKPGLQLNEHISESGTSCSGTPASSASKASYG
jgi:ATP-dependent DNA ligase